MEKHSVIIIPSLNPNENLVEYVHSLIKNQFKQIIIVNDGSKIDKNYIYERLQELKECIILTHAINMGKGRALKNSFNFYLTEILLNNEHLYSGIITVDSDGQHSIEDVIKIDNMLSNTRDSLILGVRDFNVASIPLKSSFGNKCTKNIIRFFYGGKISDTQTGLRAIPNSLIKSYLTLYGERFEYETAILLKSLHDHIAILEIPISTIYIDGNSETHFRPIQDSIAIYTIILAQFFLYFLSAASSFIIDYGIFCLIINLFSNNLIESRIWIATIIARVISSIYNFSVNRKIVFNFESKFKVTLIKYYMLCMVQMLCSASLVWMSYQYLFLPEKTSKIIVDFILFIISFYFQRRWIFRKVK